MAMSVTLLLCTFYARAGILIAMQSAPCKRCAGLLNCFSPGSAPCLPAVCGSRVLRQSGSDFRCPTETIFASISQPHLLVEAADTIQEVMSDVQPRRYKIRDRQKRKARA